MDSKTNNRECACCAAPALIFACSGASDVGAITDQSARRLTSEGAGKMFCLAGVGGRVSGILTTTAAAEAILALDGCPLECTKHCLEEAGFTRFRYLKLSDLGLEKGQSPPEIANILKVCEAARPLLTA